MSTVLSFPRQRLSYKKKIANDNEWGKNMLDNLIQYASDQSHDDYERKLSNYQLYNNKIHQASFERECNPMGIDVGQFKDEVHPYNKTYNKIQVLLGEEIKRPFNYKAVLINGEGIRAKQEQKKAVIRQYITQQIDQVIEELTQQEIIKDSSELVDPAQLQAAMSTNFMEDREILANKILSYYWRRLDCKAKKNDSFKHGLLAGEEVVWVGVENGIPAVKIINPLGAFYHKSPETKYIQHSQFAGCRSRMTVSDIIDTYGEYLSKEDIEKIEGSMSSVTGMDGDVIGKKMKYYTEDVTHRHMENMSNVPHLQGSYGGSYAEDWTVHHCEWMSSRKVYFLTAPEGETEIIGEEFVIPPHAVKEERVKAFGKKYTVHLFDGVEVEERWVREVWTGTRIGENIYCCIGPKEVQFRDADDPNSCKLGYHGVVFSNMNAESVALMDRMKPFQYLYFIVVHKLKRLIAKDKGQVFHMDLSMIPEKLGLEKTLYYLDEMDVDFFDPLKNAEKPGAYQRGKITGSTSRSNMQHIMSYIQLMDALDMQISDVAGITKQREGQIEASAAVTNTQETILRSSVITEAAYFSPHDKVWEEVMSSMVKVAQKTLKTSAIKQYVLDDLSVATLDATDADISDGSFGVFMSNNQKDHEVFETIKQLSLTLLQNEQANFSDIFTILKTDSIEEAETVIKKSEQRREQQMQQQQKMEQEQAEMQAQAVERQMEHELNKINLENQGDIVIKQMEIDANQGDRDQDAIPDELEIMKAQADFAFKKAQLALKEKELKIKSQQAAAKPAPASK